ncbi:hypothetical protein FVE24_18915, partial [Parageobacillus sp. SY1]
MLTNEQKERFQVLLQQLELTSDEFVPYFSEAGIQKLVIEKEKKCWHFYFLLPKILPYQVYQLFTQKLVHAFHHIANVKYTIQTIDSHFTESDVRDYWTLCLQELQEGVSPLLSLLHEQVPTVKGNKLYVTAR